MPRCQPGDIAVIVACVEPENIGTFVKVLYSMTPGKNLPDGRPISTHHPVNDVVWAVEAAQPIKIGLASTLDGTFLRYEMTKCAAIADIALQPIRPPKPAVDIDTTKPVEKEQPCPFF
jgi:hypothetical protein